MNKLKLVTAQVIADYLNVKVRTIHKWTQEETIPHYRLSPKAIRYDLNEIERWLDANRNGYTIDN